MIELNTREEEKITVDDDEEWKTQSLERGAEFNLIPHNRTYNLARTNTERGARGWKESFTRVLLRFNPKVF